MRFTQHGYKEKEKKETHKTQRILESLATSREEEIGITFVGAGSKMVHGLQGTHHLSASDF